MKIHPLFRSLASAWVGSALFAAASFAATPPAAPVAMPPIPPGEARIWFYRDFAPYENLAETFIRLNGAAVGVSQAGSAFYIDVPPGHFNISADSYLAAPEQTRDVDLAAGGEIYAKVLPLDSWVEGGGGERGAAAIAAIHSMSGCTLPRSRGPRSRKARFTGAARLQRHRGRADRWSEPDRAALPLPARQL